MKKKLRIGLYVIAVVFFLILLWSTWSFNFFNASDPEITPDPGLFGYYLDSYDASRKAFRTVAREYTDGKYGLKAVLTTIPVPTKSDTDLSVDVLYIPALNVKKRLLVLSSGVHGVEGFVGSAIQRMFLKEMLTPALLDSTGILIIHSMNPYGFKNVRRVTENNVDLNRNSSTDKALYATVNEGYPKLSHLINPETKVNTRSMGNVFFHVKALSNILSASMKTLRQAILQGQYSYPKGLYYGGGDFEPQIKAIAKEVKKTLNDYPLVLNIDLHTGYGERGVLHLFPNPIEDKNIRAMVQNVFKGRKIDWGDSDDFYTVTGDFTGFLGSLKTGGVYLPMVFEYGTLNSQTTLGSIKSLHVTALENQGFHHGYASPENEARVKKEFIEMYNPSSPAWRTKIMKDTKELLGQVMENFSKM